MTTPNSAAPASTPADAATTTTPAAATTTPAATPSAAATPTPTGATEQPQGDGQGTSATPPAAAAEPKPGEGEQTAGAPAEYAAFTVPEGFTLEGERLTQAQGFFKELNLSQEAAQKAVDQFCRLDGENVKAVEALREADREQRMEAWAAQSKTQYGNNFEAITKDARAGAEWAKRERPDIVKAFNEEGWGNHPDALWVFAQLGRLTKQSTIAGLASPTSPVDPPKDAAAVLYPNEAANRR